MSVLVGDFETRSKVDLTKAGADVYARDPSTDIICFGYAFDEEPVQLWRRGDPAPTRVLDFVERGGVLTGHNVSFEWLIWNHVCCRKYGWPELPVEQTDCTMVRAYAMGLPGSLEKSAASVGIADGKDMAGKRAMLFVSQPKEVLSDGTPIWHDEIDESEKHVTTYEYCKKDVEVERELNKRLPKLSELEKKFYALDQKVNRRGICVDILTARVCEKLAELEKAHLTEELRRITDNNVAAPSATGQFVAWINSLGVATESIAKAEVTEMLSRPDIPPVVREALEIRKLAAKSSTSKLAAMLNGVGSDFRLRGLFQYSAAGTRRWAGRRVQLQNFPRGELSPESIEEVFGILGGVT